MPSQALQHTHHIKWDLTPPGGISILTKAEILSQKIFQPVEFKLSTIHLAKHMGSWGTSLRLWDLTTDSFCQNTGSALSGTPQAFEHTKRNKYERCKNKVMADYGLATSVPWLLRVLSTCVNFLQFSLWFSEMRRITQTPEEASNWEETISTPVIPLRVLCSLEVHCVLGPKKITVAILTPQWDIFTEHLQELAYGLGLFPVVYGKVLSLTPLFGQRTSGTGGYDQWKLKRHHCPKGNLEKGCSV